MLITAMLLNPTATLPVSGLFHLAEGQRLGPVRLDNLSFVDLCDGTAMPLCLGLDVGGLAALNRFFLQQGDEFGVGEVDRSLAGLRTQLVQK
jgi:hypothetical protein